MNMPGGLLPGHPDLFADLRGRPARIIFAFNPAGSDAGPEMAAFGVLLGPPMGQRAETVGAVPDPPIELRCEIVHPSLLEPFAGVGRNMAVGIEIGFDTGRIAGAPDAERTDAELHCGADLLQGPVETLHEAVDFTPSPVLHFQPASTFLVGPIRCRIVELGHHASSHLFGVGIEVIIHVNTVDIIAGKHVAHHGDGPFLDTADARVGPDLGS